MKHRERGQVVVYLRKSHNTIHTDCQTLKEAMEAYNLTRYQIESWWWETREYTEQFTRTLLSKEQMEMFRND